MPFLIAAAALIAGILFWILRMHRISRDLRDLDRDTKGLQRRAGSLMTSLIGTPLQRVSDVRLAAAILMLQIVRTGSPVTAAERSRILDFLAHPLEAEDPSGLLDRAWGYTVERRPFSLVADELLPLLRDRLTEDERTQLVDMLTAVAGAHSAPGELQREALVRLRKRLLAGPPKLAAMR